MDLDQALDELYAAAPEQFVAERSRLARALKDGGAADDAAALARMRKPTTAAWVLNRLARANRREVDLLLDAGHRLREAQASVLRGTGADALAQAQRSEREAIARLTRAARALLDERAGGSTAVLGQVAESLRIAAVSPEGRELLARGRFAKPPASQGFDLANELAEQAPRRASTRLPDPPAGKRAEEAAAREALRAARASLQLARKAAREARREAERLRREADAAAERAAAAAADAEAAAAAVDRAEKRLRG